MNEESLKEGQIRVIKPFGPSIAWVKIPSGLVDKLNNYIDEVIEDKKKLNELDYGKKLATAGFKVTESNFINELSHELVERYALPKGEIIYFCQK